MNPVMNCSFDVNTPEKRRRTALEEAALQSQIDLARELESVRSELQQTRNEFPDYKAQQNAQYLKDKLEQAKVEKKNIRRSWLQIIIPMVFSALFTLLVEYRQDITALVISLFH